MNDTFAMFKPNSRNRTRMPYAGCRMRASGCVSSIKHRSSSIQHQCLKKCLRLKKCVRATTLRTVSLALLVLLAVFVCGHARTVNAQTKGPSYVNFDQLSGLRVYQPESWGVIGVTVRNPTSEPVTVLSTLYFLSDPTLQSGREMIVPAQSVRKASYPIRLPKVESPNKKYLKLKSLLVEAGPGSDRVVQSQHSQVAHDGMISLDMSGAITGVLLDPEDDLPRSAVKAMRAAVDKPIFVGALDDQPLPVGHEMLDAMAHLVIASDRIADDLTGAAQLRRWIHDGGSAMIMLDQVAPETVSLLLGDGFQIEYVDRVGLTECTLVGEDSGTRTFTGERRTFDDPVELLRVIGPGIEPLFSVNGWPAAFIMQVGNGRVLFTTLEARGWMRARTLDDPRPPVSRRSDWIAFKPLQYLSYELMDEREPVAVIPEEFKVSVAEQIGYQIVPRRTVSLILIGFCAILAVTGTFLARRDRMEQLGWMGPAAAVVVAVALMWMGNQSRQAVPPTVAQTQIVQIRPDVAELRANTTLAVYQPDQVRESLTGQRTGRLRFAEDVSAGTTRRLIWTDLDSWRWDNFSFPAGVQSAESHGHFRMPPDFAVHATLDEGGIVGTIEGDLLADAVEGLIATNAHRVSAVHFDEGGKFRSGVEDLLLAGRYVATSVVDDQQRRRQDLYRALLDDPNSPRYPAQATLYSWVLPWNLGLQFPRDPKTLGDALALVPIEWRRPAEDTVVAIPAALLPYRTHSKSTAYDNERRTWIDVKVLGTRTMLAFQVPEFLLPLKLNRAVMTVKIKASQRQVDIVYPGADSEDPDDANVLFTEQSPVGTLRIEIDEPAALHVNDSGQLLLGVHISDPEDKTQLSIQKSGWQIEDLYLDAYGIASSGSE